MTIQRLRFRMRKLREHGEELSEESGEINLVPYLDIIMNIIMFLLATITFQASLASININVPTSSQVSSVPSTTPRPELNLTVSITEKGYTLATSGAVLFRGFMLSAQGVQQTTTELPTVPLASDGKHDVAALTQICCSSRGCIPTRSAPSSPRPRRFRTSCWWGRWMRCGRAQAMPVSRCFRVCCLARG